MSAFGSTNGSRRPRLADCVIRAGAEGALLGAGSDYPVGPYDVPRDPFDSPIDEIQTLRVDPAIVGGRAVHDPTGRFA